MSDEEARVTQLVKLEPSKDWLATFWCVNCETHRHVLLLKQRVNFKAFVIKNEGGKTKSTFFGDYKAMGGAPDDKVLDDIEKQFGPDEDEDEDED